MVAFSTVSSAASAPSLVVSGALTERSYKVLTCSESPSRPPIGGDVGIAFKGGEALGINFKKYRNVSQLNLIKSALAIDFYPMGFQKSKTLWVEGDGSNAHVGSGVLSLSNHGLTGSINATFDDGDQVDGVKKPRTIHVIAHWKCSHNSATTN
jgi:hypothetical protein